MSRSKCDCGGDKIPLTDGSRFQYPSWGCHKCTPIEDYGQFNGWTWAHEPIGLPVEYTNTVVDKIPCSKMQDVASNWKNWDTRSLLLHGTTRLGKTRAAWEVFRRYWKTYYRQQKYVTMRNFELNIEQGFENYDHSKRVQSLINVPLLFIDDLGKEKTTQRVACDLFAVIDERTINHRPTIITTNFNSAGLLDRFDDKELGQALIGRFADYFDKYGATQK